MEAECANTMEATETLQAIKIVFFFIRFSSTMG